MTRTFLVKADLGGAASSQVQLGQTMSVVVELPQVAGVSKLPLSALKENQGQTAVWLVDASSMTVKLQAVSVAGADGNEAVISAGLKPGDVVVTAGVHVLEPGQKVKWLQEPAKAGAALNPPSPATAVATTASTAK